MFFLHTGPCGDLTVTCAEGNKLGGLEKVADDVLEMKDRELLKDMAMVANLELPTSILQPTSSRD